MDLIKKDNNPGEKWGACRRGLAGILFVFLLATSLELILETPSLVRPKVMQTFEAGKLEKVTNPVEGRELYHLNADLVEPVRGTERQTYEDPVWIQVPLDGAYYNHFYMGLSGEDNIPYTLILDMLSIYGEYKYSEVDDTAVAVIGQGVSHIGGKIRNVYVQMDRKNLPALTNIIVSNHTDLNWRRWLLFLPLMTAIYLLIFGRGLIEKRLELVFLILGILFGTAYTFSHGITLNGWDEQVHYSCIYQMSYLGGVDQSDANSMYENLMVPGSDTSEELTDISAWVNSKAKVSGSQPKDYPFTTVFGRVGYVFEAMAMGIARLFGGPFAAMIYICNLANMLVYVLITTIAIKHCRIGKPIMFFMALMPIQFVLACAFSYDGFVNAFMMLGFALFTEEYVDRGPVNYKRLACGLLAMGLGIIPKAVYSPAILIFALLPKRKFENTTNPKKERRKLLAVCLIAALLLAATFILPTLMSGSGGTDLYSDPRRAAANVSEQLKLVFSHPFAYAGLLLDNIFKSQAPYYLGTKVWTNFAYAGKYTGTALWLVPAFLTFITLTQAETEEGLLPQDEKGFCLVKAGGLILAFLSECLVWTALYLAFNPVGEERIAGVQGRYILPFAYVISLLFYNRRVHTGLSKRSYHMIIVAGAAYVMFQAAYVIYFGCGWYNVI